MADTLYGLGLELRPYEQTWRDTLAGLMMGDLRASPERASLVEGLLGSRGIGSAGMSALDFTPAGAILGMQESAHNGDKIGMAMNGVGLLAMGAPVAKAAAKAVAKAMAPEAASLPEILASRTASLYNPPTKSPRPFAADYPNGATTNGAGRLTHDMDGRPLTARYVVGRTEAGGGDVALPREAYDAIAEAATGSPVTQVAPGVRIGRNDYGGVPVNRYTRAPEAVLVSNKTPASSLDKVTAHEIGHVIDQISGELPTTGVMNELKGVYNTLNTGRERERNLMGPQHVGYEGADVPRELWAEFIRAYMADPNYAKTVAPKSAAALREAVSANPRLNKTVQFNSVGAPVALWSLSDPQQDQQ